MTKLNVSIRVIDYGANTWAYAINSETLKKIQHAESTHETLELVINEFIGSELVSWGVHTDRYPLPTINIVVGNDEFFVVNSIIYTDDFTSLAEQLEADGLTDSSDGFYLESREKDRASLGEVMEREAGNKEIAAYVFECISFEKIDLTTNFSINEKFDIKNLRILDKDLDVDSQLSFASYALGIPNSISKGEERPLLGVIYNNIISLFDTSSNGGRRDSVRIVAKVNGEWEIVNEFY